MLVNYHLTSQAAAAHLRFDPVRERELAGITDTLTREVSDLQVRLDVAREEVCMGEGVAMWEGSTWGRQHSSTSTLAPCAQSSCW